MICFRYVVYWYFAIFGSSFPFLMGQKFNDFNSVIRFVIFGGGGVFKDSWIHCLVELGSLGWENSSVLLITKVLKLEEVFAEANSSKKLSYQHFTDIPTGGFTAGKKVQAVWSWHLWGKPSQFHKSLCQSDVMLLPFLNSLR